MVPPLALPPEPELCEPPLPGLPVPELEQDASKRVAQALMIQGRSVIIFGGSSAC
jgi:hypothetical protein